MGQAKRRGTLEERKVQSVARKAREQQEWRERVAKAEEERRADYERRVAAGEIVPPAARRRRPMLPLLAGVSIAMGLSLNSGPRSRLRS